MAVQSTGIVWATAASQSGAVMPQWNSFANIIGAPNQTWAYREIDSSLNDSSVGVCIMPFGYGDQFEQILPANCIIHGTKVYVVRSSSFDGVVDSIIRIVPDRMFPGGAIGDNKADSINLWPTTASPGETKVYGESNDLWNAALTRESLTGTNLAIALGQVWSTGSGAYDIFIDAVGIEIFYEEAQTTGPLFPATAASSGWTNPNNAKADDTSYATRTFAGSEDPGVATGGIYLSDFGASIPAGSTILGCAAVNGRFATTAGIRDRFVQLHRGGALIGANKWVSGSNWGTGSTGTVTYGNAANDDWGVAGGLNPELVNDPAFGILFEARNNNASARQANLDFASLEFHYIEPDEPIDLAPGSLATGVPGLDSLQLGQKHALAPGGIGAAAPVLAVPGLGQRHALAIGAVAAGAPDVDAPAIGSFQDIELSGITTGWPVLGSPSVLIADPVVLLGIASGAPMLGAPPLGSIHVLMPNHVDAGAPVLGMPGTGSLNVFVIAATAAGAPMVDRPIFGQFVPPFEWRPAEPVPGFWTPVAATDVEWSS